MYKRLLAVLIISTLLITTSCSKDIPVDKTVKQDNTPAVESVQTEAKGNQSTKEGREPISREQAGLNTISVKDISNRAINNRIESILKGDKYLDSDYLSGIVQDNSGLVLNERFNEAIIGSIKIGSSMDEVIKLLGEPSAKEDDYLFYKTNKLYMAFKGTGKVEAAILSLIPKAYDKDILNKLLSVFDKEGAKDLFSVLEEDKDIRKFFEKDGHIHGGGWYAESSNGVAIEDFVDFTITVYNNFEGNLYKSNDMLIYENKDYMFDSLKSGLKGYYWTNEEFAKEGILSPSGKYNSIYEWITSDWHNFTIRTMDNSKPDFFIGVPAGDYRWINDDYILYLDFYSSLPFAVKTSEDDDSGAINIFYETGLIKSNDSTEGIGRNDFEIVLIKDNTILIKNNDDKKEYEFQFNINTAGKLDFKYLAK